MEELILPPQPDPGPTPSRVYPSWMLGGIATAVIIVVTVVTDFLYQYLGIFQRLESSAVGFILIRWLVMNLLMFLPWSGLWALGSRVFRQEAHFLGHLNTTLLALLAWTWISCLINCVAFSLSIDAYAPVPYYGSMWLLGMWALGGHLRLVSRASQVRLWAAGGLLAGLVVGIALAGRSLAMQKMPALRAMQVTMLPGFMRLAGPDSVDVHLAALVKLQAEVDRRALEK